VLQNTALIQAHFGDPEGVPLWKGFQNIFFRNFPVCCVVRESKRFCIKKTFLSIKGLFLFQSLFMSLAKTCVCVCVCYPWQTRDLWVHQPCFILDSRIFSHDQKRCFPYPMSAAGPPAPPLSNHRHCKQVCFQLAVSEVGWLLKLMKDDAAVNGLFPAMFFRLSEHKRGAPWV